MRQIALMVGYYEVPEADAGKSKPDLARDDPQRAL